MKVQCLTSKRMLGDEQVGTDFNSSFEELAIEYKELDGSENMSIVLPRNFKSSPSPLRKSNSKVLVYRGALLFIRQLCRE